MDLHAYSTNIDKLLKEDVYVIPDYQRVYSWGKIQVEELLDDIEIGIINDSNHFFGTMMLNVGRKKEEKLIEIIDGQQRFTTVMMILYAILEMYKLPRFLGQENVQGRINTLSSKLANIDDDGQIVANKLTLGEGNKEFFEDYIIGALCDNIKKDQIVLGYKNKNKFTINKKIVDNYKIIIDYLTNNINDKANKEAYNYLKEYQRYILNCLEIVKIEVSEDADAFLIFETLNDRGLALSSVDLIKNILFKNCAKYNDFEKLKEKWISTISNLDDISEVKKYLRHYWISKFKYVSPADLFKKYRGYVNNDYNKSREIINELYDYSNFYNGLKNPHCGCFSNKKLIDVLDEMNCFKFDLAHPILIAIYAKYRDEEILYKVSKVCLNFLIRYISIMKEKPTAIEKKIGEIAIHANENEIVNLFKENSDDNILRERLKNMSLNYRSYLAYYCLVEYEKSFHKNEPWISTGRSNITVEHILPRTINAEDKHGEYWIKVFGSEEECKLYQNRIGNLTLLGVKPQSKGKNYNFEIKKEVYKSNTEMLSTKEICNYSIWDTNSIESRQEKMVNVLMESLTLELQKIK